MRSDALESLERAVLGSAASVLSDDPFPIGHSMPERTATPAYLCRGPR
jgi:hypothetical protein